MAAGVNLPRVFSRRRFTGLANTSRPYAKILCQITHCPPPACLRYADSFDHHLQVLLGYRTPEILHKELLAASGGPGARFSRCCDLGCGTGLMGVLVRGMVRHSEGVDLSAGMVDQARQRQGVYDRLAVGEVVSFLDSERASPSFQPYDLLLAADVLVYISDLGPLFRAASSAAAPGALFGFSTEKLEEGTQGSGQGYLLRTTGRYAHLSSYVARVCEDAGWEILRLQTTQIRKNLGEPVVGDVVLARKKL